jgi:hypothetical protein
MTGKCNRNVLIKGGVNYLTEKMNCDDENDKK